MENTNIPSVHWIRVKSSCKWDIVRVPLHENKINIQVCGNITLFVAR